MILDLTQTINLALLAGPVNLLDLNVPVYFVQTINSWFCAVSSDTSHDSE